MRNFQAVIRSPLSAAQVVGALMSGNGASALLSDSALSSALDVLASHIPQVGEDQRDTELEADVAALSALDAVLFSRPVLLDVDHNVLRPAAIMALVAFFQLAWVFGEPDAGSNTDDGEFLLTDTFFSTRGVSCTASETWLN